MPPKNKAKKQKAQESEDMELQNTIQKIHQKKQTSTNYMIYLVQWKGKQNKSQWQWKPQKQLMTYPGFNQKLRSFIVETIKKTASALNKKKEQIKLVKQSKPTQKIQQQLASILPQKVPISICKSLLQQKLKMYSSQQGSLDKFVSKLPLIQKKQPEKCQSKLKQIQGNTFRTNNQVQNKTSIIKVHQIQKQSIKVTSKAWMQKIKAIKTIKGYELKNGQLSYEVQVWDKNGQILFVPPLSSEAVRSIDQIKLANFLQDCLIRGYQAQKGAQGVKKAK